MGRSMHNSKWSEKSEAGIKAGLLAGVLMTAAGCRTDSIFNLGRAPKGERVIVAQTLAPRPVDDAFLHNAHEADLVEETVASRDAYVASLRELHDYYAESGDAAKRECAAAELAGLNKVQQFQFIVDAEVPPADLRPTQAIPEADRRYEQAIKLMNQGGRGLPGLYRESRMLEALRTFKSLIEDHPTSDKIDDAAFFCGEIHKEYLKDQELIAVRWYERAVQWNPGTPHPARFQAAVQYDYRLHDRARALELYQQVLTDEKDLDVTNTRFSSRRIDELMRQGPVDASDSTSIGP